MSGDGVDETEPSYYMSNEVDPIESDVIESFLTPMTGRGEMPKGQHPEVRTKANQFIYNMDAFTYDGNKIWVDQCSNPTTPEWLQNFDLNLPEVHGEFEIHSNLKLRFGSASKNWETNELCLSILGCSEMALRQQHHDNGYDPARQWHSLLDPVFQRIAGEVDIKAREWIANTYPKGGVRNMPSDNLPFTIVQCIGHDSGNHTIYGRIFQPDGASDVSMLCREGIAQKALLSFRYPTDDVERGDIFIVWTNHWVSADSRIFDAVNLSNTPEPTRIPSRDRLWLTADDEAMVNNANASALKPPRVYGTGMALQIKDITPRHMIHPSRNNAFGFWMADKLFSELIHSGEIVSGDVSESIPDMFIPSYRDKRGQKIVDLASPMFPHYHDEIRCPTCNGRVLVKARADNKISEAVCPHCKSKIQFPHLTNATVKTVGVNE